MITVHLKEDKDASNIMTVGDTFIADYMGKRHLILRVATGFISLTDPKCTWTDRAVQKRWTNEFVRRCNIGNT